MSKFYKPTIYNKTSINHAWVNVIYSTHDLICGCEDPIAHLNDIVNKQKCLPSTATTTTGETTGIITEEENGFDEGDLQKLFEESDDIEG